MPPTAAKFNYFLLSLLEWPDLVSRYTQYLLAEYIVSLSLTIIVHEFCLLFSFLVEVAAQALQFIGTSAARESTPSDGPGWGWALYGANTRRGQWTGHWCALPQDIGQRRPANPCGSRLTVPGQGHSNQQVFGGQALWRHTKDRWASKCQCKWCPFSLSICSHCPICCQATAQSKLKTQPMGRATKPNLIKWPFSHKDCSKIFCLYSCSHFYPSQMLTIQWNEMKLKWVFI